MKKRSRIDDPEVRKAQILSAAEAVMGEKGYHAIHLEDVARRAGVSKGTLYIYFKDKEGLLAGLLTKLSAEHDRRMNAVPNFKQLDPLEKLRRVVGGAVAGIRRHRGFFAQISTLRPEIYGLKAGRVLRERFTGHLRFLAGLMAEGIRAGKFRPCEPSAAALMLMALVREVAAAGPGTLPVEDSEEAMTKTILDFFLRGVGR